MVNDKRAIAHIHRLYAQYYEQFMTMKMQLSHGKLVMIYTVN